MIQTDGSNLGGKMKRIIACVATFTLAMGSSACSQDPANITCGEYMQLTTTEQSERHQCCPGN